MRSPEEIEQHKKEQEEFKQKILSSPLNNPTNLQEFDSLMKSVGVERWSFSHGDSYIPGDPASEKAVVDELMHVFLHPEELEDFHDDF